MNTATTTILRGAIDAIDAGVRTGNEFVAEGGLDYIAQADRSYLSDVLAAERPTGWDIEDAVAIANEYLDAA